MAIINPNTGFTDVFDELQGRLLRVDELATRRSGFTGIFGRTDPADPLSGGGAMRFREESAANLAAFDLERAQILGRNLAGDEFLGTGLSVTETARRRSGFTGKFGGGRAEAFSAASPEATARFQSELQQLAPDVAFEGNVRGRSLRLLGFTDDFTTRGLIEGGESFIEGRGIRQQFNTIVGQIQASDAAGGVQIVSDPNVVRDNGLTEFKFRELAREIGFQGDDFETEFQTFVNATPGLQANFNSLINRELSKQARLFGSVERFREATGKISLLSAASSGLSFAKFITGTGAGQFIDKLAAAAAPELFNVGVLNIKDAIALATQEALSTATTLGLSASETIKLTEAAVNKAASAAAASKAGTVSLSGALSGAAFGFTVGSFFAPGGKTLGAQVGGTIGGAVGGAIAGAELGSIIPGPGTIIGAVIGAVVGSFFGPSPKVPQSGFFAPFSADGTFKEGETRFASKTQSTQFSQGLASAVEGFTTALASLGIRFFAADSAIGEGFFGGNLGGVGNITTDFPSAGINVKTEFAANDSTEISKGIVTAVVGVIDPSTTSPITNEALKLVSSEGKTAEQFLTDLQAKVIELANAAGFVDEDGDIITLDSPDFVDINGDPITTDEDRLKGPIELAVDQFDDFKKELTSFELGLIGKNARIKTSKRGILTEAPTRKRRLFAG